MKNINLTKKRFDAFLLGIQFFMSIVVIQYQLILVSIFSRAFLSVFSNEKSHKPTFWLRESDFWSIDMKKLEHGNLSESRSQT